MASARAQYGRARADFDGDAASNQLSFRKDDVVLVTNQLEGGWWFGTKQKDGKRGYFPSTYVQLPVDKEQKGQAAGQAGVSANAAPSATRSAPPVPSSGKTAGKTSTATTASAASAAPGAAAGSAIKKESTSFPGCDWVAFFHKEHRRYYYTNQKTKESVWVEPADFTAARQTAAVAGQAAAEAKAPTASTTTTPNDYAMTVDAAGTGTSAPTANAADNTTNRNGLRAAKSMSVINKQRRRSEILNELAPAHTPRGTGLSAITERTEPAQSFFDRKSDMSDLVTGNDRRMDTPHAGDLVQPKDFAFDKALSYKLSTLQTGVTSFTAPSGRPQGWLMRLKNSKSLFSSNPFKREYFTVVPRGGSLSTDPDSTLHSSDPLLCRFRKRPAGGNRNYSPGELQEMATEVYDLSNNRATGISIYAGKDESFAVRHVFFVMEEDEQAQMILAADCEQDAERWVYTLREILKVNRSKDHMRNMPTDEKVLDRLFLMVLKSLALPDAKQGEMQANFSPKQKWQLIKLNKARVDNQAMAAAMGSADGTGTPAEGGRALHASARKWARRAREKDGITSLRDIRALKTAIATEGLDWLQTFEETGGIGGLLHTLLELGCNAAKLRGHTGPPAGETQPSRIEMLTMQRETLATVRGLMNNEFGVSAVASEEDGLDAIAMQVAPWFPADEPDGTVPDNTTVAAHNQRLRQLANEVTSFAVSLLGLLCWFTGDSDPVYDAFRRFRYRRFERYQFESLVGRLHRMGNETDDQGEHGEIIDGELCVAIMTFVNDLINNQIDLEGRLHVREPFLMLHLRDAASRCMARLLDQAASEREGRETKNVSSPRVSRRVSVDRFSSESTGELGHTRTSSAVNLKEIATGDGRRTEEWLEAFEAQIEVFDIIYRDDRRDAMMGDTDLFSPDAVSTALCANADQSGHSLHMLAVFRRLMLFPCLGTINVGKNKDIVVDVGKQALGAVAETARRIFDIAIDQSSIMTRAKRGDGELTVVTPLTVSDLTELVLLRQTYQEEAGKNVMETERAVELEKKLQSLTARYTGQRKQLGELYGQLAQYKQALEAEQQYRDVVMAHAQQAIAAAENKSSGGVSEEALAAAVAEALAEEARKVAAGDSTMQDEAVRDAVKNYHELRKSRSQVAELSEKLRQCERQIKILEMQGGGGIGGGSRGNDSRHSALGIGSASGGGFRGGMPMQLTPRSWASGGAGGRPLVMPRGSGRPPPLLPSGARGARGARGGRGAPRLHGGARAHPRLPVGARGTARGARGGRGGPGRGGPGRGGPGRGGPGRGGPRGGPRGVPRGGLPKKANVKPSVDLKPLFWSKINDNKIKGTIWDPDDMAADTTTDGKNINEMTSNINGVGGINDADVDIDIEMINTLFLKQNKSGPSNAASANKGKRKGPVTLLDGKRLQNVGIQLSRFSQRGLSSADIRSALLRCQEDVLTIDRLSGLLKVMPTQAEIDLCMDYEGDASKLGKVEKFFRALADVPHAKLRIEALMAKDQMEDQVAEVQDRLEAHCSAIAQLKTALRPPSSDGVTGEGLLRKLFQVVLRVGNYVNGGTRRGGAYGIQLDAVIKMASVKTSDKKSNLLRFCAKELASDKHAVMAKIVATVSANDEENNKEQKDNAGSPPGYRKCFAAGTGDLRASLSSLEEASKSPLDEILKVVSKIGKGIQVIRDCMEKCLESPNREDSEGGESAASENINKDQQAVQTCFSEFLDYAEGTRGSLSTRLDALSEEGEKISRLFAENPKKVSSSEVYAKILKIVDAFENASAANERDATNEAKRAKRDQKMKEKGLGKKQRGGTFAQHKMFQSGGANDIVARVRERNKKRSPGVKKHKSRMSSSLSDWNDAPEAAKMRAPAPPKPPPHLQALGK